MTVLRVLDILEEQGKTKYWLCKRMEMHYVSFNKMVNNQTASIRFDTIDRMAQLLEVSPGELFLQIPDDKTEE
ncbi:MAG: helix-turn-helix transcriptional regulator [Lachnospiraceae bacterium]|nr:helix-turn-helix transcriptional regulator [Lachnospiraceae bacterium]